MLVKVHAAHPHGSDIAAKAADLPDFSIRQDWERGVEQHVIATTPDCLASSLNVKELAPAQNTVARFGWQLGSQFMHFATEADSRFTAPFVSINFTKNVARR